MMHNSQVVWREPCGCWKAHLAESWIVDLAEGWMAESWMAERWMAERRMCRAMRLLHDPD